MEENFKSAAADQTDRRRLLGISKKFQLERLTLEVTAVNRSPAWGYDPVRDTHTRYDKLEQPNVYGISFISTTFQKNWTKLSTKISAKIVQTFYFEPSKHP